MRGRPIFDNYPRGCTGERVLSAAVTTVITATRKTHTLFGRGVVKCRPKLTQMTHDLQVAEIFLAYRHRGFDLREHWVLEDHFPHTWPIRVQPDCATAGRRRPIPAGCRIRWRLFGRSPEKAAPRLGQHLAALRNLVIREAAFRFPPVALASHRIAQNQLAKVARRRKILLSSHRFFLAKELGCADLF